MHERRMLISALFGRHVDRAIAHLKALRYVGISFRAIQVLTFHKKYWRSDGSKLDKERRHIVIVSMSMITRAIPRVYVIVPTIKLFRPNRMWL